MSYREKVLEDLVVRLARWLKRLSHDGAFNPEIRAILEEARQHFRSKA